jgi:hypothetical protein
MRVVASLLPPVQLAWPHHAAAVCCCCCAPFYLRLGRQRDSGAPGFGNARAVRNLLEAAISRQSARVLEEKRAGGWRNICCHPWLCTLHCTSHTELQLPHTNSLHACWKRSEQARGATSVALYAMMAMHTADASYQHMLKLNSKLPPV